MQSALRSQDATERWFSDSFSRKPEAAGPDKAPNRCWVGSIDHGWEWAGEGLRTQGFKDVMSLERVVTGPRLGGPGR